MRQRDCDSTVARIAGNILSGAFSAPDLQGYGIRGDWPAGAEAIVMGAVRAARAVVAEVKRTEPGQEA